MVLIYLSRQIVKLWSELLTIPFSHFLTRSHLLAVNSIAQRSHFLDLESAKFIDFFHRSPPPTYFRALKSGSCYLKNDRNFFGDNFVENVGFFCLQVSIAQSKPSKPKALTSQA